MSDPGSNDKQGVSSSPHSSSRALFRSAASAPAPPRARLWLGLILGGVALLAGGYLYRAFTRPAPAPPLSSAAATPPPEDPGPPLPLDAVVRVQGGTFKMGSTDGGEDERPVTETTVATFDIGLTEVTVAAYRACVEQGKCTAPDEGPYCTWGKPGMDRHPVNCVDWQQASAYCAFVGKRLPTEAEWEFAARGADDRRYPWKDGPPTNQLCWNGEGNDLGKSNRQGTCAAGRYPTGASPFGVLDMAGNVWEWTASAYCPSYEGKGCSEDRKVIRGGGWNNVKAEYVRAQDRSSESVKARNDNVGLRCARTPN